jgi:hypothetical protein
MSNVTLIPEDRRKEYIDILKLFMIGDSEKGINAKANYLVALGLSTYTEILGGLCFGNLQSDHQSNYERFLKNYFDKRCNFRYMDLDKQLKKAGFEGLYGLVRSGFVHRYLLSKRGKVVVQSNIPLDCAIIYSPRQSPEFHFVVKEYLRHFKCAFDSYYNDLIIKQDQYLIDNFSKALTRSDLVI